MSAAFRQFNFQAETNKAEVMTKTTALIWISCLRKPGVISFFLRGVDLLPGILQKISQDGISLALGGQHVAIRLHV